MYYMLYIIQNIGIPTSYATSYDWSGMASTIMKINGIPNATPIGFRCFIFVFV